MRRFATLAVALLLSVASVSIVTATDTEADAIYGVYEEWGADNGNHGVYLSRLDGLFEDASPACRNFISILFSGIALFAAGTEHSPENGLGTMVGVGLIANNIESAQHTCRIAI